MKRMIAVILLVAIGITVGGGSVFPAPRIAYAGDDSVYEAIGKGIVIIWGFLLLKDRICGGRVKEERIIIPPAVALPAVTLNKEEKIAVIIKCNCRYARVIRTAIQEALAEIGYQVYDIQEYREARGEMDKIVKVIDVHIYTDMSNRPVWYGSDRGGYNRLRKITVGVEIRINIVRAQDEKIVAFGTGGRKKIFYSWTRPIYEELVFQTAIPVAKDAVQNLQYYDD